MDWRKINMVLERSLKQIRCWSCFIKVVGYLHWVGKKCL